ncbi:MAG TPA: DUF1501 domain-containing protein [Bryobacteraceae bacterium]|jgi:hypothetical protein|nr:DUF1501 domain-containing protein [Bryobacteraceae bacterium]
MDQQKWEKILTDETTRRRPAFFGRPHWTRRNFFQVMGAGIAGSFLAQEAKAEVCSAQSVTTVNKAENVIFILLSGAPSHVDTFDFKMTNGVTPATAAPATINGVLWPTGILPKLGNMTSDFAVLRSVRSHALVHSLAQTWAQIGRNPAGALGNIAPNIGSIVALEKASQRRPSDILPTFLALNSGGALGPGYLDSQYAPFKVNAGAALPNTANGFGQARWQEALTQMHAVDDVLRIDSPLGKAAEDMDGFYESAKSLMYNPAVNQVFTVVAADSQRYGNNAFGNACLVAKQALTANAGARFVQITLGGWDMHTNIYTGAQNIFTNGKILDDGLSALLSDLKGAGLLDKTLVVAVGEFGRTPQITAAAGRDHYANQFAFMAGGGVKGGRVIGQTNATGASITDFGWSRNREINVEDIEASIYSALGINWTNVCYNDPFKRGFEYVPNSPQDYWGPIDEVFK